MEVRKRRAPIAPPENSEQTGKILLAANIDLQTYGRFHRAIATRNLAGGNLVRRSDAIRMAVEEFIANTAGNQLPNQADHHV